MLDQREMVTTREETMPSKMGGSNWLSALSLPSSDDVKTSGIAFASADTHHQKGEIEKTSRADVDGMPVGIQPRGLADMRREDYVRAGRDCGYDYVFVLTLSNGKGELHTRNTLLFTSNTAHKNIWLRARLVDVASGNYVYRNNVAATAKTHNGYINGRVAERSVAVALQEIMDDIEIDNGVGR